MSESRRYQAFGLNITTNIELDALEGWNHGGSDADLELVLSDGYAGIRASGERMTGYVRGDAGYELLTDGTNFILHVLNKCIFRITDDTRRVEAIPLHGTSPAFIGLLAMGTLIATVLLLRGEWPLHASAVCIRGHALAFSGVSGGGKSTLAAALCREGCELISDDLLRWEIRANHAWAFPGSVSIRLRGPPTSLGLSDLRETSVDGRYLYRPNSSRRRTVPLSTLLIPEIVDGPPPPPSRCAAPQALALLLRQARLPGSSDSVAFRKQAFTRISNVLRCTDVWLLPLRRGELGSVTLARINQILDEGP